MQSANKKKLSSDFDADLIDAFAAECKVKGVKPTAVVREFLEKFCGRKPAEKPKKKRVSKAKK